MHFHHAAYLLTVVLFCSLKFITIQPTFLISSLDAILYGNRNICKFHFMYVSVANEQAIVWRIEFMCDVMMRFMWQHKRVFCIPIIWTQFQKFYLENCFAFVWNVSSIFPIAMWIRVDGNFPKSKRKNRYYYIACTILTFISLMWTIPFIARPNHQKIR